MATSLDFIQIAQYEYVILKVDYFFYNKHYKTIQVHTNGIITLGTGATSMIAINFNLDSIRIPIICPFADHIDTRGTGVIYYREDSTEQLLSQVSTNIQKSFTGASTFVAQRAFIATWENVGFYNSSSTPGNTFQVVIVTDGQRESYAMFLYENDGLRWLRSQPKLGITPRYPLIGFAAGNGIGSYSLYGSSTANASALPSLSNVDIPGKWLYQIGNGSPGQGGKITPAVLVNGSSVNLCSMGYPRCSSQSICNNYATGYCCACPNGTKGNGKICYSQIHSMSLADATVQINVQRQNSNTTLSAQMHGLAYPRSFCRCYLAMSRIPIEEVIVAEVILDELGLLLGWYYADRAVGEPESLANGHSLAGDGFHGTSRIHFGLQSAFVLKYSMVPTDANADNILINIETSGLFPDVTQLSNNATSNQTDLFAQFEANDQYFYNVAPGKELAIINNHVNLNGTNAIYRTTRFIYHTQCSSDWRASGVRVRSTDSYRQFTYDPTRQMVQSTTTFALTNTSGDVNFCALGVHDCDPIAQCFTEPYSYRCVCPQGYTGDGHVCIDVNECYDGTICQPKSNSYCINTPGSYKCQCFHGYLETANNTCIDLNECSSGINNCSQYANCTNTIASYYCDCWHGYYGDGNNCTFIPCRLCHRDAICTRDRAGDEICTCKPGYEGDGRLSCRDINECSSPTLNNCSQFASCTNSNGSFSCACLPGYKGNGENCTDINECVEESYRCVPNSSCDNSIGSFNCSCNDGYRGNPYAPTGNCTDINECEEGSHNCHRYGICTNSPSTFSCRCETGFIGNGTFCELPCKRCFNGGKCINDTECDCPPGFAGRYCQLNEGSFLAYAQGYTIQRVNFPANTSDPTVIVHDQYQLGIGIDFDCKENSIYWSNIGGGKSIMKSDPIGGNVTVVATLNDSSSVEGIAIDSISRTIYWTDSGNDVIEVMKLDGTNRQVLFDTELVNPRAIAIDPVVGFIFWTDWNRENPRIVRSTADGKDRVNLVVGNLKLPNALTLDTELKRVYWADAGTNMVEYCSYTGEGRKTLHKGFSTGNSLIYPFALALYGDYLYWSDWSSYDLQRIHRITGKLLDPISTKPLGGSYYRIDGIASVIKECSQGANACGSMPIVNCNLCLPGLNNTRTCY
ncbi:uncharacterized protein TRIADDRAFT_57765 [Trichoplax adhaerens]|uniref:Nidogen-1 n=1 Tax=Trichoplax adhaerens TaxID=10228 RepID=B3S0C6_TRIAD|nr:hypothetical protein TRIADDRAFT_57765 [Trichoplax adhaerens]EDV23993.1 hypothetical protein TRIADDRAFT_57765 [Trichoplax adhaerens]|eukprot:XP_002113519.1 hypothetical protein TRIADDRAFT_57765 [Trichoplax adhaerens]